MSQLPHDWMAWIHENHQRGCSPESMLQQLTQNGFASHIAYAALKEAFGDDMFAPAAPAEVDLSTHNAKLTQNTLLIDGHPVRIAMHLDAPFVMLFENLLSDSECDEFIALSDSKLLRSTVVDDESGEAVLHQHRTSSGCTFHRGENPLITTIEQRIAHLLNCPAENGEGLQILRYEETGEYRPHFDFFDPELSGSAKHLAKGGQRVATVIMYLSDVTEGGGTRLPSMGLEIRPHKGSALFFANTTPAGEIDRQTLHAGKPVITGVKYIATKWLREREYK